MMCQRYTHVYGSRTMKENKLGRKFANTWSPPKNRWGRRRANKGVRKYAKLTILKGR